MILILYKYNKKTKSNAKAANYTSISPLDRSTSLLLNIFRFHKSNNTNIHTISISDLTRTTRIYTNIGK